MRDLIKIFKALSDPNRVRILKMLEIRPLCVCEFPSMLKISMSTVSKHLSILRDCELIIDRKAGKWVIYTLNRNAENLQVRQILSLLPTWLNDDEQVKTNAENILHLEKISCNL